MKILKAFCPVLALLLFLSLLCSCSSQNGNKQSTNPSSKTESTTEDYSYKKQMDIAMENAKNPKVLAKVNDYVITQVDLDLYDIDGKKHDLDFVIRRYVIADYMEEIGVKMPERIQVRYDEIADSMKINEGISEEYCLETYGISQDKVIEYAKRRIYQIGMNSAFGSMVIDETYSGEAPIKHPELKKAHEKFKKESPKKGYKAYENFEDAYYEMIKKDYNIVIY